MLDAILIGIYFVVALISIKVGLVVFYHFKKFKLPDNEKANRLLSIYKWGSIILISISFALLIIIIW